ncbi:hypothetical protein [Desulfatibacillum alkenivorans]|jgi:hypothetical protein|uniref:hypothetical protein n=1 Tax=Desulfatibacillum alkenivorans TaxID=259354 RepID=UPI00093744A5|nr:hypothetical protein [Desulfatibacillum alkenivorans]
MIAIAFFYDHMDDIPDCDDGGDGDDDGDGDGGDGGDGGDDDDGDSNSPERTSRQARRDAMRKNNSPTSRSADSQTGSGDNRQYVTEGSDGKPRVQTHHNADAKHPDKHWHDAKPKVDPATNEPIKNKYDQIKYYNNGSSSSSY